MLYYLLLLLAPVISLPTEKPPCLGCYQQIPVDSAELKPVVKFALNEYNGRLECYYLQILEDLLKAEKQIVAGVNYKLHARLIGSNCRIDAPPSPECKPRKDAKPEDLCFLIFVSLNGTKEFGFCHEE